MLLEGGGQPSCGSAWLELSPKITILAAVVLLVRETSFSFSDRFSGQDLAQDAQRHGAVFRVCFAVSLCFTPGTKEDGMRAGLLCSRAMYPAIEQHQSYNNASRRL